MSLLEAVQSGSVALLEQLIASSDFNVNAAVDDRGNTPLILAAFHGHVDIVRRLLAAGASVDAVNQYECAALHKSATRGHLGVVSVLIEAGAAVDMQNSSGCTPLMWAVEAGEPGIAALLIKSGANIETRKFTGETCLIAASNQGRADIVRMLLRRHADRAAKDRNGHTALDIARSDEIRGVLGEIGPSVFHARRVGDSVYEEVRVSTRKMEALWTAIAHALKIDAAQIKDISHAVGGSSSSDSSLVAIRTDDQVEELDDYCFLEVELHAAMMEGICVSAL